MEKKLDEVNTLFSKMITDIIKVTGNVLIEELGQTYTPQYGNGYIKGSRNSTDAILTLLYQFKKDYNKILDGKEEQK